jgi:hypothetical protein
MRIGTIIAGAAAGAAMAAGVGLAAYRRLRGPDAVVDAPEPPAPAPAEPPSPVVVVAERPDGGDDEVRDPAEAAALREELRSRVARIDAQDVGEDEPEPAGSDPATEAARARLRAKAADARTRFRD